jgi:tetratricopeptide (TPR) repeat protein
LAAAETTQRTGPTRLAVPLLCLGAVGLLAAAYANVLDNAFHFDDGHVLVENLFVRSLGNIPRFFADAGTFSKLPANATYRPLVTTSLALDYAMAGGLHPRVFHASQIVQMAVLGLALFFFYRRTMDSVASDPWNRYLALFAATLFCVHTLNTETMNLMHARSEILSALGVVGAFLIYMHDGKARRLGLHNLAMLAGALAKPPAVLFGPLLFVFVALSSRWSGGVAPAEQHPWRGALRRAFFAAALPTVLGAIAFVAISRLDAPGQNYGGGDRYHYALSQVWAWLHYLRLFVLPLGLTADTDLTLIQDGYDTRVFAGALVLAALTGIAARCAMGARTWPVAFGLAWFALALAPASSIIPLAEPMNEHRPFLALIGLILAVIWAARLGWQDLVDRHPGLGRGIPVLPAAMGLALLAAHVVGDHYRNETWRDGETLWRDVVTKSPANGRGWMNYGLALMSRGDYAGARASFDRAQALTPNYYVLEINQGVLAGATGDAAQAEARFKRAVELAPALPDSHFYYGRWLVEHGRSPEAIDKLERAVRLTPGFDAASSLLMDLQMARGDATGAASLARAVLAIDPGNRRALAYAAGQYPDLGAAPSGAPALFAAGVGLGGRGKHLEAALAYRAALAQDPHSVDSLNNLGWTLGKLGFFAEAASPLEEAVRQKPDFALARNNLAWVRSERK